MTFRIASGTRPVLCLLTGSALVLTAGSVAVSAHENQVSVTETANKRCIVSNGLPDHATGQFPNRGNPHTIRRQNVRLCVTKNPRKSRTATMIYGSVGVALNGVQIRPGTADYYDPSSPRGFSRDRRSGWNLEGMGAASQLGMDRNAAHVDERGLYHYHGVSGALKRAAEGTLIGYAADGFEIHLARSGQKPSYRLKPGQRPSGPGGRHDGTYNQDWQFVAGSGTLDQCNGGMLNGRFVYFATKSYPFFPRCLWGRVSADFRQQPVAGRGTSGARHDHSAVRSGRRAAAPGAGNRQGPPPEAVSACQDRAIGSACQFRTPRRNHQIAGSCRRVRNGAEACVPDGHGGRRTRLH